MIEFDVSTVCCVWIILYIVDKTHYLDFQIPPPLKMHQKLSDSLIFLGEYAPRPPNRPNGHALCKHEANATPPQAIHLYLTIWNLVATALIQVPIFDFKMNYVAASL